MYKLTERMLQRFENDLKKYHELFSGKRCETWHLEELIFKAINSDTRAGQHASWFEGGDDDKADIVVRTNGNVIEIEIRLNTWSKTHLRLSGYRFASLKGDFDAITHYLNSRPSNFLSIPYQQDNDENNGMVHRYRVCSIDTDMLKGLHPDKWEKSGANFYQTNPYGIDVSVQPKSGWLVWWKIPLEACEFTREIVIREENIP